MIMEFDKVWEEVLKSKEIKSLKLDEKQKKIMKGICRGVAHLVLVRHILDNKK